MKTFEVIINSKSSYVSAVSKKAVMNFFVSSKPSVIRLRNDIDPSENFQII